MISLFLAKWLQYYLDFCDKNHHPTTRTESLSQFLKKLGQKSQTGEQVNRAEKAIALFQQLVVVHRQKNAPTSVATTASAAIPIR